MLSHCKTLMFGWNSDVKVDFHENWVENDSKLQLSTTAESGHFQCILDDNQCFTFNSKTNYSCVRTIGLHCGDGQGLLYHCLQFIKSQQISYKHLSCGMNIIVFTINTNTTNDTIVFNFNSLMVPVSRAIGSNIEVKKIACGDHHCLISTQGGELYSYGSNKYGELGIGDVNVKYCDSLQLIPLDNLHNTDNTTTTHSTTLGSSTQDTSQHTSIIDIACGTNHSVFITSPHGFVYTFGCGAYYRLGHVDDLNRYKPTFVTSLQGVGNLHLDGTTSGCSLCSAGTWHTVVCTESSEGSNDVYGWGWNQFGQIGTNNNCDDDSDSILSVSEGEDENEQVGTKRSHQADTTQHTTHTKQQPQHVSEIVTLPRRISDFDDLLVVSHSNNTHNCINNHIKTHCQALPAQIDDTIIQLSCGSRHTAVRTERGRVLVVGQLDIAQPAVRRKNGQQENTQKYEAREMDLQQTQSELNVNSTSEENGAEVGEVKRWKASHISSFRWGLACVAQLR